MFRFLRILFSLPRNDPLKRAFFGTNPLRHTVIPLVLMIGTPVVACAYAFCIAGNPELLQMGWHTAVEPLTRLVASIIPGIARTERELIALGLPSRAYVVADGLAMGWILCALGALAILWCLKTLPLRSPDEHSAAVAAQVASFRAWLAYIFMIAILIGIPFFGGAKFEGKGSWDFTNGNRGFVPLALAAWLFWMVALLAIGSVIGVIVAWRRRRKSW